MPFINVKAIEKVFTTEEKQRIIAGITEVLVSISGEAVRRSTWVAIEEVADGSWGMGGRVITSPTARDTLGRADPN